MTAFEFLPAQSPNPRSRDFDWAVRVASAPAGFGLLSVVAMIVAGLLGLSIPDTLSHWGLVSVFGMVVFLPLMVVGWVGAGALAKNFWTGRWLVSIVNAATVGLVAMLIYGTVYELLHPESRDPYSWAPAPTIGGTIMFAVPYTAIAVANVYVVVRLWRQRA